MKRIAVTLMAVVMAIGAFSGLCFASQEEAGYDMLKKADVNEAVGPISCDRAYPEQGFRTHSWITQESGKTVAHTQVIDQATGTVLKQVDESCSYSNDN